MDFLLFITAEYFILIIKTDTEVSDLIHQVRTFLFLMMDQTMHKKPPQGNFPMTVISIAMRKLCKLINVNFQKNRHTESHHPKHAIYRPYIASIKPVTSMKRCSTVETSARVAVPCGSKRLLFLPLRIPAICIFCIASLA